MVARRTFWALVAVAAAALVALAVLGTQVRPINDDYCNARGAYLLGPVGFANERFMNWHGGWVAVLVLGVFGWPIGAGLLTLPYAVFAPVTALLGGLGPALLLLDPVGGGARGSAVARGTRSAGGGVRASLRAVAVAVPLAVVWLLAVLVFGHTEPNAYLGYTTLYWQAASVVHVWPVLLAAVLGGLLYRAGSAPRARTGWSLVLLGFAVGLFNLPESLAVGIALIGTGLLLRRLGTEPRRGHPYWALAGVAALIGGVVSYLAPGRAARDARQPQFASPTSPWDLVTGTLDGAWQILREAVLSPATIVAFVGGYVVLRVALRARPGAVGGPRAGAAAAGLGVLGVLLALTVAAGQEFSYSAPWHVLAPYTALALAAACVGAALAAADLPRAGRVGALIAVVALGASVAWTSVEATTSFVDVVRERLPVWEKGPAPLGFLSDIEVDVMRGCAADIGLLRP